MLKDLRDVFGADEAGFWRFFRALNIAHPNALFTAEVQHPLHDIGEMVPETDKQGNITYQLNTRPLPTAQKIGAALPKGSGDPKRNADVAKFIEFIRMVFGPHADYELDCLAHMAQTGLRPGNMLFLMGDGHTGKTMYADGLSLMFDGACHTIPGNVLKDSFKFALLPLEGARIGQVIELPASLGPDTRAALDSLVKIVVDPSKVASTIAIEGKGTNIREVPNYVRLVVTSNFQSGLHIGEQDRRVFYIVNGINLRNSPPKDWWQNGIDPIMKDERRLASVWRYLLDRDTGKYDRTSPPPLTVEKIEAQRVGLTNPVQRHARDAIMALIAAERTLVDAKEIAVLMSAVAHNEWKNSGRKVDDRPDNGAYDFSARGSGPGTVHGELGRAFTKLAEFKSGSVRLPTVYVRKGSKLETALADEPRKVVLDHLDDDRARHPVLEEYLGVAVRGPVKPPPNGGEFDD